MLTVICKNEKILTRLLCNYHRIWGITREKELRHMQKEKGIVSIKVKLLGVIVPVVIVSILVLVLIAYRTSAGLIES